MFNRFSHPNKFVPYAVCFKYISSNPHVFTNIRPSSPSKESPIEASTLMMNLHWTPPCWTSVGVLPPCLDVGHLLGSIHHWIHGTILPCFVYRIPHKTYLTYTRCRPSEPELQHTVQSFGHGLYSEIATTIL